MNGNFYDSLESESYGSLYGEDLYDSYEGIYDDSYAGEGDFEYYDAGEARLTPYERKLMETRRRKELERRRRAIAQARAREARRGRQPAYPPAPQRPALPAQVNQSLQKAQAVAEKVDLENKVQTDIFGSALARQGKRISRGEYAQATQSVVTELEKQFPDLFDGFIGPFLRSAPLAFLEPDKKGSGLESFLKDPRVLGLGAALAIKLFNENRSRGQRFVVIPDEFTLHVDEENGPTSRRLVVRDINKQPIDPKAIVTFESLDITVAEVDQKTGVVTAKTVGDATIEATVNLNGVNTVVTAEVLVLA